jgi:hypothetical protein
MKKLLTFLVLLGLLLSLQVSFISAQEPTEEPAAEPSGAATVEPDPEVAPFVDPAGEPADEAVEEVMEEPAAEPPAVRDQPSGGEVGAAGALSGSFTTQIISIANLETSGSAETASLDLRQIGGSGSSTVTSGAVYPGGATFIRDSELPSDGEFSGVVNTAFSAAAVALTVNSTAGVADAYPGLGSAAVGTELFGTLIFNKHYGWESILYCQNAGSSAATISAELFKTGEAASRVTLTSSSLDAGAGVKWDIADDTTVQTAWPGANGEYGYARFTSSGNIACVVDSQRMTSPYVQTIFQAVPTTGFSSMDLRVPLVFNGHGTSSANSLGYKWITGISIVNTNASDAVVAVEYTASTGYTNSCSATIPGNSSDAWVPNQASTALSNFTCTGGPLPWSYPGPTFGSARITSNIPVLAIGNSNRYDTGANLGAGYSSLAVAPTSATSRAVCPLAFKKDFATDWTTGIQVANVGSNSTSVTFRLVPQGADPATSTITLSGGSVAAGDSATAVLQQESSVSTGFEGVVFVESGGEPIAASSSNTNYTALGAGALYDCINY